MSFFWRAESYSLLAWHEWLITDHIWYQCPTVWDCAGHPCALRMYSWIDFQAKNVQKSDSKHFTEEITFLPRHSWVKSRHRNESEWIRHLISTSLKVKIEAFSATSILLHLLSQINIQTSFASFCPCSVAIGFSFMSFSLAMVLGSSRRSIWKIWGTLPLS